MQFLKRLFTVEAVATLQIRIAESQRTDGVTVSRITIKEQDRSRVLISVLDSSTWME